MSTNEQLAQALRKAIDEYHAATLSRCNAFGNSEHYERQKREDEAAAHLNGLLSQLAAHEAEKAATVVDQEPVAWLKWFPNAPKPEVVPGSTFIAEDALAMGWRPLVFADAATPAPAAPVAVPLTWNAPSTEAAHAMGANGGTTVEAERLAFEAWMRGHCWALCATWTGTEYLSDAERDGAIDPRAIQTRQLWAAWRDRAALANGGRRGVKLEGGGV